ncbi:hypothetical protein F4782DRAFT_533728 [Xylaria castorea]|nr:hypothetical protein F4782DRAFT_533728 [Xylaria castorea]
MAYAYGMSLHATVYIEPKNVNRFFDAFKPVFDKVIAEPECMFSEVYRSQEEPGKITWVEDWSKSPTWFFENQITKDYYKEYLAITEPMFILPRAYEIFERLSPGYCYKD